MMRIAMLHRDVHAPFIDTEYSQKRSIIHATGVRKPAHDGVDERGMRNRFPEGRRLAVLEIGVNAIEVSRETGEIDNVRTGDRAARRFNNLPDTEIFEIHTSWFRSHNLVPITLSSLRGEDCSAV